jgi:hypothetical protein
MLNFRKNNLVYIAISKHAITFHRELFTELGWTSIAFETIDWNNDIVFAHILNPFDKHLKATAEAIYRNGFEKLLNDPILSKLLAWSILDYHSLPVVATLGEEICNKIDWIPLDGVIESNILTTKFLEYHGIDIDLTNRVKRNKSNSVKDGYIDIIKDCINKHGTGGGIDMFYKRDYLFYCKVMSTFNCDGKTWDKMSWLRKEN